MLNFLVAAFLKAFQANEFKEILVAAIATAIRESESADRISAKVNSMVGATNERYEALGLKGKFLKGFVLQEVSEMATKSSTVAEALKTGQPYLQAVIDGLDPEDIASTTEPIADFIQAKIYRIAQEFLS